MSDLVEFQEYQYSNLHPTVEIFKGRNTKLDHSCKKARVLYVLWGQHMAAVGPGPRLGAGKRVNQQTEGGEEVGPEKRQKRRLGQEGAGRE